MVKKLFWNDPYLTQLETSICSVEDNKITLRETIFYAFSGGQESDQGTIGGKQVLDARKEGKEIIYTVETGHGFRSGECVNIVIDWERRYKLMRLHFAAEIVLELVYRKFPGIQKVGAHIAQDKSRIDFIWDQNMASILPMLQQEAQDIIAANQEIISAFNDEIDERRYWKIDGFAQVACGGTHIKRTGEVGEIKLKRVNPGKGKERVEIYVG